MHRKRKARTPDAPLAPVPSEILDEFVGQGPISHEELEAAVRRFKKAIIERALGGELTHHLGYPPGGHASPRTRTNHRNGTGGKTVLDRRRAARRSTCRAIARARSSRA